MNETQFKSLALWEQRATQIGCSFERYFQALRLFGNDANFQVWLDGSVGFIDHSKAQTFEDAAAPRLAKTLKDI